LKPAHSGKLLTKLFDIKTTVNITVSQVKEMSHKQSAKFQMVIQYKINTVNVGINNVIQVVILNVKCHINMVHSTVMELSGLPST
jgi:hypothetical protein